jgi:hypothetical protein
MLRYFGEPYPSESTFERAFDGGSPGLPPDVIDYPSGSAHCTVVYSEKGEPAEIAFWGFTGD